MSKPKKILTHKKIQDLNGNDDVNTIQQLKAMSKQLNGNVSPTIGSTKTALRNYIYKHPANNSDNATGLDIESIMNSVITTNVSEIPEISVETQSASAIQGMFVAHICFHT